jgi:hypothetical protein
VDFRDCVQKSDLAQRTHANFDALPLHVRGQITDIIKRPTSELVRAEVENALSSRVSRLFTDEQYAVNLFQVRMLHANTLLLPELFVLVIVSRYIASCHSVAMTVMPATVKLVSAHLAAHNMSTPQPPTNVQ